jgi:hypothetical protein
MACFWARLEEGWGLDGRCKAQLTDLSVCVRCQTHMSTPPEARREFSSQIAVVASFLVTAISIACEFWYIYPIFDPSTGRFAAGIAALASPFAFLCACVLVFFRPRAAYGLGLAAGLMALPWFILAERSSQVSSWIIFNAALEPSSGAEVLKIVSVALIVISSGCATLRLLPDRWTLRKLPLGQRNWPAIATGFLVLGIWLYHAGTPYQIPAIVDEVTPEFRILRVEKRGLRFHETAIRAYRNGKFMISRNERHLFQYKFETQGFQGMMPYKQVEAFRKSIELWARPTAPALVLHSWNAEGWYVVGESKILAFTSENKMAAPNLVVDMFSEIDELPVVATWTLSDRDVCLGFCYGPMAALGFKYVNSFARYSYLTP